MLNPSGERQRPVSSKHHKRCDYIVLSPCVYADPKTPVSDQVTRTVANQRSSPHPPAICRASPTYTAPKAHSTVLFSEFNTICGF